MCACVRVCMCELVCVYVCACASASVLGLYEPIIATTVHKLQLWPSYISTVNDVVVNVFHTVGYAPLRQL